MRREFVPRFEFPRVGKVMASTGGLLLAVVLFFALCVVKIKPGYAGIVYNL